MKPKNQKNAPVVGGVKGKTTTSIYEITGKGNVAYSLVNIESGEKRFVNKEKIGEKFEKGDIIEISEDGKKVSLIERGKNINKVPEIKSEESGSIVINTSDEDIFKKGGVYFVGGEKIPDAMLTQRHALERGINTKIVEFKKEDRGEIKFSGFIRVPEWFKINDYDITVVARAESKDKYVEKGIILNLKTVILNRILKKIEKYGDGWKIDPIYIARECLDLSEFLPRIAETKATERAQKSMLNQEFREKEEIEFEEDEVKRVGISKK